MARIFAFFLFLITYNSVRGAKEAGGNRRVLLIPDQPPVSPAPPPITGHFGPRQPEPVPPAHLGGAPAMEPTSPPIAGLYGQDCTPASGDFPDQCKQVGQTLRGTHGKIQCIHNHDCCICGQMICGPDCTDLVCNGDSSCFGVKYIDLIGEKTMGARIDCNGDVSCMQTNIHGTNINLMGCTGDFSCAYSRFHLECISRGCPIQCVGDDSCKGHPTDPTQRAYFDVTNSLGMLCSHDSCRDATFNLNNNVGGAIVCGAEAACTDSTITADNVEGVLCGGEFGCYNANLLMTNPQNGFSISCAGFAACRNLNVEILVTDPEIEEFRGIICNSAYACEGMQISIHKVIANPHMISGGSVDLHIEELSCGASKSCKNAVFDIGPNIFIENCRCAGGLSSACDNLRGVAGCVSGLQKLECVSGLCKGMTETITNPLQDFELVCNDAGSCSNFALTIVMDGTSPTTAFKGIKCGSPFSCTNMNIMIINYDANKRIDAGEVFCSSSDACINVKLDYYYTDVGEIHCDKEGSCPGCTVSLDGRCSQCAVAGAACL